MAYFAERADSYAFYTTDVWLKNLPTFLIALTTFVVIAILAWRNGRTYCNTICPVGDRILGFLSRYAWLRPHIDTSKCNSCGLCARNCKASCIDPKEHRIDYSRCVTCMDCLETCHKSAITYTHPRKITGNSSENHVNVPTSRRQFLVTAGVLVTGAIEAQEKKVDGGLAPILDKEIPQRSTSIAPPGALSLRNMAQHCTACQLCVSVCPNQVLRPSGKFLTFMQPEMVSRARILPAGMYQMFRGMSCRSHTPDYPSRQIGDTNRSCRMDTGKLHTSYRWSRMRELRPPLSHRCHTDGRFRPVGRKFFKNSGYRRRTLYRLRRMRELMSEPTIQRHLCRRLRTSQDYLMR